MIHGSDNDMEYVPSNAEFTEWLASKFYNHKTMDHYTKNAKLTSLMKNPLILMMKMKLLKSLGSTLTYLISRHICIKLSRNLITFYESIKISLLKILMDLRLTKIKRMIGYMSRIKTYHGYMKNHGPLMEYGKNSLPWNIIVNHSHLKVDIRNGQLVAGKMTNIVTEGTCLELT
ncbi:hypothetical protein Tco_0776186 [Tanacetum coccineum]